MRVTNAGYEAENLTVRQVVNQVASDPVAMRTQDYLGKWRDSTFADRLQVAILRLTPLCESSRDICPANALPDSLVASFGNGAGGEAHGHRHAENVIAAMARYATLAEGGGR